MIDASEEGCLVPQAPVTWGGSDSRHDGGRSHERIMVFVPMYNCANQIERVIAQFDPETQKRFARLVVIDNRSTDDSLARAAMALRNLKHIETLLLRNDENYGLGGSHKVAFLHALEHGFDHVVVLHGDDQGAIADLLPMIDAGRHREVDCVLGARFMPGSRLVGYSAFRTWGNRLFNVLFSIAARQRLYDLGSGLNLYATRALRQRRWLGFADDLTFNYYMILASVAWEWRITFFPLIWREDDQVSNVRLFRQARRVIGILGTYVVNRRKLLTADYTGYPTRTYTASVIQLMADAVPAAI